MAEKDQALLKNLAAIAGALDSKSSVEEMVTAVQTIVAMYRAMKVDTEAERAARTSEFATALRTLRSSIDGRLSELRGSDGKDGKDGVNGKDGVSIAGSTGPAGKDGKSIIGPMGRDGKNGIDGSPDSADDIRNKLELLTGKERLTVDAIDGLKELIEEYNKKVTAVGARIQMGGTTGRDLFNDIDLSPQLDGVSTTFQIHAVYNIISVHLSSFPHALRKNIDFTYTPTTITFTAQIDPATSLAAGQTAVLTVVNA